MKSAKALRISVFALTALSLLLSVALLWSVRLNYSGPAYDGMGITSVQDVRMDLPAFSDEWVMAGYVQKSIERNRLSDFHPLDDSIRPAENPLMPLVAAIAFFSKQANIDIVTHFSSFVFMFQVALVLSFFVFMRACKVSAFSSALGTFALLFLPESNIMQGIWIMLPAYIGAIFLMLAFALVPDRDSGRSVAWPAALVLIAGVLYPPYLLIAMVFVAIACVIRPKVSRLAVLACTFAVMGIVLFCIMGIGLNASSVGPLMDSFWRIAIHERFGVSTAGVWSYMPILFYVAGFAGAYVWFANSDMGIGKHRKKIIAGLVACSAFLLLMTYGFDIELILGHQRVVFLSWLVLIAMGGFVIDRIALRVREKWPERIRSHIVAYMPLAFGILMAFQAALLWYGTYPSLVPWEGIATRRGVFLDSVSAMPVMKHMLPDDFESIIGSVMKSEQGIVPGYRLLAPPYLALAIAASTGMAPVSTVDSIVSVRGPAYADFEGIPQCDARLMFARDAGATHVLVHVARMRTMIGCAGFSFVRPIGELYVMYSVK